MNHPPQAGQVIRYAYLWHREAQSGQEEGVKDRPCAIILSVGSEVGQRVIVLPITHTPPLTPEDGVVIPAQVKQRLGLDPLPSWILVTEGNQFFWPGPDLRPTGSGLNSAILGFLPAALFRTVRDRFVERWKYKQVQLIRRSE